MATEAAKKETKPKTARPSAEKNPAAKLDAPKKQAAAGGKVKRRNLPKKWVDRAVLLLGLVKDTTQYRRASAYFTLHHEHDISNALHELDWHPRPFSEGIREVAQGDWWREPGPG